MPRIPIPTSLLAGVLAAAAPLHAQAPASTAPPASAPAPPAARPASGDSAQTALRQRFAADVLAAARAAGAPAGLVVLAADATGRTELKLARASVTEAALAPAVDRVREELKAFAAAGPLVWHVRLDPVAGAPGGRVAQPVIANPREVRAQVNRFVAQNFATIFQGPPRPPGRPAARGHARRRGGLRPRRAFQRQPGGGRGGASDRAVHALHPGARGHAAGGHAHGVPALLRGGRGVTLHPLAFQSMKHGTFALALAAALAGASPPAAAAQQATPTAQSARDTAGAALSREVRAAVAAGGVADPHGLLLLEGLRRGPELQIRMLDGDLPDSVLMRVYQAVHARAPGWPGDTLRMLVRLDADAYQPGVDEGIEAQPMLRNRAGVMAALRGFSARHPEVGPVGRSYTATVRMVVTRAGNVAFAIVQQSSGNAEVDAYAGDVAAQMQFDPAQVGPRTVDLWVTIPVTVTIQPQPGSERG
jgi:TonB family protein